VLTGKHANYLERSIRNQTGETHCTHVPGMGIGQVCHGATAQLHNSCECTSEQLVTAYAKRSNSNTTMGFVEECKVVKSGGR
jgi:hypothetical protein